MGRIEVNEGTKKGWPLWTRWWYGGSSPLEKFE